MSKFVSCVGAAIGVGLWSAAAAYAAVSYSTGAAANFTVAPGAAATVPIYLRQTGTEISGGGGLFSSGFLVAHTGAVDDASVIGVAPNTPVFDALDPASTYSDTMAAIYQTQDEVVAPALPTANLVLLGTLTIQASSTPGKVSGYSIGDFDADTTQNLTYDFTELDASIANATFTVTAAAIAVPEPTTLAALGVATALVARRARRR